MAKFAGDHGEAGLPSRLIRVLVYEMLDDRRDLGQPALLASNREHLNSVDTFDHLPLCFPAELQRRLGVFLRDGKIAIEDGLHRPAVARDPLNVHPLARFAEHR